MMMRRTELLLLFILLLAAPAQGLAQAGQCLAYEPATVSLRGRIIRRTFPGPPNYESVKRGDQPETYWILHLDAPVCVTASADNDAESGVKDIQLILPPAGYARFRKFVGQSIRVDVRGKLLHAISGHHHTPVLLEAADILKGRPL
jgi:hypothetical protein